MLTSPTLPAEIPTEVMGPDGYMRPRTLEEILPELVEKLNILIKYAEAQEL